MSQHLILWLALASASVGSASNLLDDQPYCTLRYRRLCQGKGRHIACQFPTAGPGETCENYTEIEFTNELKHFVTHYINRRRQRLAAGYERVRGGAHLPKPEIMMLVEWDRELAVLAQRLADQCSFVHDDCRATVRYPYAGQTVGEVKWRRTSDSDTLTAQRAIRRVLDAWWGERRRVTPKQLVAPFRLTAKGTVWGHFSQLAVWTLRAVGCGAIRHGIGYPRLLLVCDFSHTNMLGQRTISPGPQAICPLHTARRRRSSYPLLCAPVRHQAHTTTSDYSQDENQYDYNAYDYDGDEGVINTTTRFRIRETTWQDTTWQDTSTRRRVITWQATPIWQETTMRRESTWEDTPTWQDTTTRRVTTWQDTTIHKRTTRKNTPTSQDSTWQDTPTWQDTITRKETTWQDTPTWQDTTIHRSTVWQVKPSWQDTTIHRSTTWQDTPTWQDTTIRRRTTRKNTPTWQDTTWQDTTRRSTRKDLTWRDSTRRETLLKRVTYIVRSTTNRNQYTRTDSTRRNTRTPIHMVHQLEQELDVRESGQEDPHWKPQGLRTRKTYFGRLRENEESRPEGNERKSWVHSMIGDEHPKVAKQRPHVDESDDYDYNVLGFLRSSPEGVHAFEPRQRWQQTRDRPRRPGANALLLNTQSTKIFRPPPEKLSKASLKLDKDIEDQLFRDTGFKPK